MKIKLDYTKSIEKNIQEFYEKLKKIDKKKQSIKQYIDNFENKKNQLNIKQKEKNKIQIKKQRFWYEKFHYFFIEQSLVLGGRDSTQNDLLYSKYFENDDLFFHADIQGASVVIFKNSKDKLEELHEVAQFSASFSKAWAMGISAIDVYCVNKDQVTKNLTGSYVSKGSYVILGERIWFKSTPLELKCGLKDDDFVVLPKKSKEKLKQELILRPGKIKKGALAKKLAKRYNVDANLILQKLPNGLTSTFSN